MNRPALIRLGTIAALLGTRLGSALAVQPAGSAAAPPAAESPEAKKEHARILFRDGTALKNAGHYQEAARVFEQAYALAPAAGMLFNVAQAYRLGGECKNALRSYRQYLTLDDVPSVRAVAREHMENLEKQCGPNQSDGATSPTSPPPAADPPQERPTPIRTLLPQTTPSEPQLNAGPTTTPAGQPAPIRVLLPQSADTKLGTPTAPFGPGPREDSRGLLRTGQGLTALGGAAVVVGGALWLWNDSRYGTWSDENEFLRGPASNALPRDQFVLRQNANDQKLGQIESTDRQVAVIGIAGVAVLAAGIVVWRLARTGRSPVEAMGSSLVARF